MLEILRLDETNYEGTYVIDTSNAWRGSFVYVSGVSADGKFKLDLPKTGANATLCRGVVTYWPLIETGSDTSSAIDKLTKGARCIYLTGNAEYKIGPVKSGNGPLVTTSFSALFSGSQLHTVAAYTATAFDKSCFIGFSATNSNCGKLQAAKVTGTGITLDTAKSSAYWGPRIKVRGLYGDTATGVTAWINVDWGRFGATAATVLK